MHQDHYLENEPETDTLKRKYDTDERIKEELLSDDDHSKLIITEY